MAAAASFVSRFSGQFLEELFQRDDYVKRKIQKTEAFHHIVIHFADVLSALNVWDKKVQKKEDPPSFYNYQASHLKLTPLHVAAIRGNIVAVQFFLEKGANTSLQDARGWTPLHHAAARRDTAMLDLLQERGEASAEIRNIWGASPHDFLTMQEFPQINPDTVVCQIQRDDGLYPCSAETFQEMTGATFVDKVIATTGGLYEGYIKGELPPIDELLQQYTTDIVVPKLSQPRPPLALRHTENIGLETISTTEIPADTVIGEYTGLLEGNKPLTDKSPYYMYPIEAQYYRNLMAMCNDGPPKAQFVVCYNYQGLACRVFIVAIKTILPNTPIITDYGLRHLLKLGRYHLSGAQQEEILRLWAACNTPGQQQSLSLRIQRAIHFNYLLSTPAAILILMLSNQIRFDLRSQIVAKGKEAGYNDAMIASLSYMLKEGQKFLQAIESFDPREKQAYIECVIKLALQHELFFAHLVLSTCTNLIQNFPKEAGTLTVNNFEKLAEPGCKALIFAHCRTNLREYRASKSRGEFVFPDLEAILQRLKESL